MVEVVNGKINVYKTREPRESQYYQCVRDHFEEFERVWDDKYQRNFGVWRPFVTNVIYKYLDCGDLQFGFARVKCNDCHHEYLVPFSCKCRHFCPSCHQKRVIEFGEYLFSEVLKQVPHRQWVFSIPKRLRLYFLYDRKLLPKLSKCIWKILSSYLQKSVTVENPTPGAVFALQTFGESLNFNPHFHIIVTDGCFYDKDKFMVGKSPNPKDLELIFRTEVLKMLKKEGKINGAIIENMNNWQHSGFNVYCGESIDPDNQEGIERLAQYIVRAPFSQERMTYIPEHKSKDNRSAVIYTSKTTNAKETFSATDFLARLITHIPNKGEQLVKYYGYYSNKSRGLRKKEETGNDTPAIINSDILRKSFRKNWARLIHKIYHVDPLICPKCSGKMKIIAFIEEEKVIKKILVHLNLWI